MTVTQCEPDHQDTFRTRLTRDISNSAVLGIRQMIGIVPVTHGNLGREFVAALEHVVGSQQCVAAVCIGADDDMEKRHAEILATSNACNTGDGVVVLSDMFGGTPSNLSISIMSEAHIEVLGGVNLPMLVKLISMRAQPIAEAVRTVQETGRKQITVASQLRDPNRQSRCVPSGLPDGADRRH